MKLGKELRAAERSEFRQKLFRSLGESMRCKRRCKREARDAALIMLERARAARSSKEDRRGRGAEAALNMLNAFVQLNDAPRANGAEGDRELTFLLVVLEVMRAG